jgi:hypothetical protein
MKVRCSPYSTASLLPPCPPPPPSLPPSLSPSLTRVHDGGKAVVDLPPLVRAGTGIGVHARVLEQGPGQPEPPVGGRLHQGRIAALVGEAGVGAATQQEATHGPLVQGDHAPEKRGSVSTVLLVHVHAAHVQEVANHVQGARHGGGVERGGVAALSGRGAGGGSCLQAGDEGGDIVGGCGLVDGGHAL